MTDASPSTGVEFQGMVADIFKQDRTFRRIIMPGSSLVYAMQDAVSKSMALVWSIWVMTGPLIQDVAYVCNKVACITTHSGIEVLTLMVPDVLRAFIKYINGTPLAACRTEVNFRQIVSSRDPHCWLVSFMVEHSESSCT